MSRRKCYDMNIFSHISLKPGVIIVQKNKVMRVKKLFKRKK